MARSIVAGWPVQRDALEAVLRRAASARAEATAGRLATLVEGTPAERQATFAAAGHKADGT
jgi:hypothetical protein